MKMMIRVGLSVGLVLLTGAGAVSCSLLQLAIRQPEVKLERVRVTDPGLKQATLMFDLSVMNPNSETLKIDGIDYKLVLNGQAFAEGLFDQQTQLPGESTTEVSLPIRVEYSRVFDSLMSALQKPESEYQMEGSARLGIFTIPFSKKGSIKWQGE